MTWVDEQATLDAVVDEALEADEYALDTEFHRERTYYPDLALVQLAWPGRLVLVDPYALDLAPLRRLLQGPGLAVLHAADQDLEVLDVAVGAVPRRLFDTQLAAGFLGMSTPSLTTLVEKVLGRRLPKGDRLTDWTRRPLTPEQQSYAASDVEHLAAVREHLVRQLDGRGRLAWAEQECEAMLHRPRGVGEADTAWWKLKETRQLRGKARGIAQELAAWRERRAAELDMPPRFVLPDMALASIANRPPSSLSQLREVRGMDGRYLKGDAAEQILDAVRRGAELPSSHLRLPPGDELDRTLRPAVTLVSAWVAQLAADLEIDAGLLATRADLHAFLRREPGARLATGWRHGLVGEPVRLLVEGEAALAFDGEGELVLEARSRRSPSSWEDAP
jgi:ribonuclease D